ncbi:shikimate dehydrogenase [Clostridium sp. CS001]|uniref:shikimate dehydrogenase n=1 Tax=Clostridium sp. CS001 TaxID=2880648 RepID=UPI001CF206D3|nr:shikimate dehydrogenase [Clostridium sp. CS001]MCB2291095.1 shikimate dehydrogenase [Clostridium sp. CS001]
MGIYGLLGETLKHSISPRLHSIILKKIMVEGTYELFETQKEEVKNTINTFKDMGVVGVNVTIPYKTTIMKYIDETIGTAKKIGAVNTICFKNKKTIGYNTDYTGFGMLLKNNNIDTNNKKAVILGNGGAAKAVIEYLIDNGISEITIVSRSINESEGIKDKKEFNIIPYEKMPYLKDKDIIINCTPCGMYPSVDNCPIEKSSIAKVSSVVDLIYNPKETLLLKHAKELNKKAVNGLYMLIGQAIAAQEIWQDKKIDKSIINSVYEELR